jgi:hypothetical protein
VQALLGPIAAAAYNLTFQLGFATTQICESVAVAVQTLLAREMAGGDGDGGGGAAAVVRAKRVRHLISGSILVGGAVSAALSLLTFFQRDGVLRGLTTNAGIREASAAVFPVVLVTQGESIVCLFYRAWRLECFFSNFRAPDIVDEC